MAPVAEHEATASRSTAPLHQGLGDALPRDPAEQPARRRTGLLAACLAGLLAGAAATALTLPVLNNFSAAEDRLPLATARIDALERQIKDLAARPAARDPRVDELAGRVAAGEQALQEVKTLQARIGKLENAPAAPAAAPTASAIDPTPRLAAMDAAVGKLSDAVAELRARVDAVANRPAAPATTAPVAPVAPVPSVDLQPLTTRIAALEDASKSLRAALGRAASDGEARFATAALGLRMAVEAEGPYAPELAAVRAVAKDPAALAALEPFAATGLPSVASLVRDAAAISERRQAAEAASGGFWERIQSAAGRIVRVRTVDAPDGVDAGVKLRTSLARGDLDAALAAARALPPPQRAAFDAWIARADARAAALATAQGLTRSGLSDLARPRSEPAAQ